MKTCFFIGHRDAPESIYERLLATVEHHISEYGVTDFVVGRYGSFDRLAARAVMEAKQHHSDVTLTLLMPYYRTDADLLPDGFDGALFPDGLETVPKRAIFCPMASMAPYFLTASKPSQSAPRSCGQTSI